MFKKYLENIDKCKIYLISYKNINGKIINANIFNDGIPNDLKQYYLVFSEELNEKINNLESIEKDLEKDVFLAKKEKEIIKKEIFFYKNIAIFLGKVYDIEANKIDENYKIRETNIDYDYYNNLFFGVSKKDLEKKIVIQKKQDIKIEISKDQLIKLLEFAKNIIPEISYSFVNNPNMFHKDGKLGIPREDKYNIKSVIVLFFHEMTHFIRALNGKNNFGIHYTFSNYNSLEEGIAKYNEYYYGNQIINYGEYSPYYDACYQIILKNTNEKIKKEEINKILKNKGFSKEKSNRYYERFYRYSQIGSKNLFLKDLIYTKSYNNVKKLINNNNYEEIMKGRIGIDMINSKHITSKNNIDSKAFFEKILKEIKSII